MRLRVAFAGWASLLLLAVPSLALAQPAEDPGLADAPPPPAPPPPSQPPTPSTPPTGNAAAMPPQNVPPPPPPEVSETTDVQTQWVQPSGKEEQQALGDLYERVAAPTMFGGVGLFRTITGDSGRSNTFRI